MFWLFGKEQRRSSTCTCVNKNYSCKLLFNWLSFFYYASFLKIRHRINYDTCTVLTICVEFPWKCVHFYVQFHVHSVSHVFLPNRCKTCGSRLYVVIRIGGVLSILRNWKRRMQHGLCIVYTCKLGAWGSLVCFEIENKEDIKSFGEYLKFQSLSLILETIRL